MLYENDVVNSVVEYLQSIGYTIESACFDYTQGHDIVATHGNRRLFIEAKGEGSQDKNTRRFGETFTTTQVLDHVAKAWFKCSHVLSEQHNSETEVRVAIAVPDNQAHRHQVGKILPLIKQVGACVFWVESDRSVIADAPFPLK